MFSRPLAALAAASLIVGASASVAQERTPTSGIPTTQDNQNSDMLLILGAIAAAALLTFLATQLGGGDKPASP